MLKKYGRSNFLGETIIKSGHLKVKGFTLLILSLNKKIKAISFAVIVLVVGCSPDS
jgi:hypothetical protein